jgi:hypothetical protein
MKIKTNEELREKAKTKYFREVTYSTPTDGVVFDAGFLAACEIKDKEIADLEDFIVSLVESCDMGEAADRLEEKRAEILRKRNDHENE